MRGRKPKPTKLKIMAGKPGHRPLPKDEPVFTGRAVRPHWLNEDAVKVWDELAPVYAAKGLVTDGDAWLFGMLCTEIAVYEKEGAKVVTTNKTLIAKLWSEFGGGPAARARIQVKPQTPQDDEQRFFGGKTA